MTTKVVLLWSVLALATAIPNGLYHQEYNYKSSSSSFKNNELQHKNDESGFYSKDGDLEGRVRPKVNSHNEHSEYVNPKLQTHTYTGLNVDQNGAMDSYGRMNALPLSAGYNSDIKSGYGSGIGSGYNGASGSYGSNSGYSYSGSYGMNSGQQYGSTANLQSITRNLQSQLEGQLHDMTRTSSGQSSYALTDLENDLKRRLNDGWSQELQNVYGDQSIRGGQSYSIRGGRVQTNSNYNLQELDELKRQVEANLLSKLRSDYRQSSSSSSSSSQSNFNSNQGYIQSTTYRPYSTVYPNIYTTPYRADVYPSSTVRYDSYSQHSESQVRYTPIPNPASLTSIASTVQSDLDSRLNELLDSLQQRYFTQNAYAVTNYEVVLSRLQNELRSNVTSMLENEIRRNYGNQNLRDGYQYSIGPNGQYSAQYNYNQRDLDSLKTQIERNLLEKLNSDFNSKRTRFAQSYSSSSSSSNNNYGSNYGNQYNSGYQTYSSPRPYVNSGIKTQGNQYQYSSGSSHSGYAVGGSSGMTQLQRQLQEDLSRQLQLAISKNAYNTHSGYSSGGVNSNTFQMSLQQLQEELNRNLTRQLEDVRSGYGSYSTYGGNSVSDGQLVDLKNSLQGELQRQLQQGLQRSWSSSSSYSASASSSNLRPVRGLYLAGKQAAYHSEPCDDHQEHQLQQLRSKRHIGYTSYGSSYGRSSSYQNSYGQQPQNWGYSQGYQAQYNPKLQQNTHDSIEDLGQKVEEDAGDEQQVDLGQQVEDDSFGKLQVGNQYNNQQQVQDGSFGKLEVGNQYSSQQQADMGQQVEDDSFGKLQVGNQYSSQQADMGQQVEDDSFEKLQIGQQQVDLGQQVEDYSFGKLQVGSQHNGQEQVDLGQQIEDDTFGKLQVGKQYSSQQVDLGQVEDDSFGKLEAGIPQSEQQVEKLQVENMHNGQEQVDLGQQIEDDSFGKLQVGSQHSGQQQVDLGQQVELDTLGKFQVGYQQSEPQIEKLQIGNQYNGQQQVDLGQQVEDDSFGKLQVGNQHSGQQQVDLGQQVEEDTFEKLQVGSQPNERQVNVGQQVEEDNFGQLQVEEENFGKSQIGQQSGILNVGQQVENDNFGQLQVGNLQTSKPINQQSDNQFYQQPQYADVNQQIEDSALGKPNINLQQTNNNDQQFLSGVAQDIDASVEIVTSPAVSSTTNKIPSANINQEETVDNNDNQEALRKANEEGDRLIEAIRASRRRSQQGAQTSEGQQPYRGYNYGYNSNSGYSQQSQYNNYNSRHQISGTYSTNNEQVQQQPENERTYESNAEITFNRPRPGVKGGYNSHLNHGTQQQLSQGFETTSNLEPWNAGTQQQAHITYGSGRLDQEETHNLEVEPIRKVLPEVENTQDVNKQVEEIIPTTEKVGWWSNFKNKVSNTATKLKDKITGQ